MAKRRHAKKKSLTPISKALLILLVIVVIVGGVGYFRSKQTVKNDVTKFEMSSRTIDYKFLSVNPYSRPGIKLGTIKGVVVHYTANPGAAAINNRNYFENLKTTHLTHASAHFIIGLQGEIIQCIPLNEIAYASNNRNYDTISIECAHPDSTGKFNSATYDSLVELVSSLAQHYHLDKDDVIRHYDVTGKLCPKYFVENPSEWKAFKNELKTYHGLFS